MLLSPLDHQAMVYQAFGFIQVHQYSTLIGLLCLYILYVRYRSGLHRIPGPWLASISSIWRFIIVWKQDMPATSIRLHQKYGPLVRIGPYHVSVADPDAVKIIYGADSRYHKVRRPFQTHNVCLTRTRRQHSIRQPKPVTRVISYPTCFQLQEVTTMLASGELQDRCIQ